MVSENEPAIEFDWDILDGAMSSTRLETSVEEEVEEILGVLLCVTLFFLHLSDLEI